MKACFDEAFRRECERIGYPIVLRDTEELLVSLLREKCPKKLLEIGTCIGYSGCLFLSVLPEAQLVTVEIEEEKWRRAKENFAARGYASRVLAILGDCREVVPALSRRFDLIFLDGPKGQYAALLPYLEDLLEDGGMLVADNVCFHGVTAEGFTPPRRDRTVQKNLRQFSAALRADPLLETEFFGTGDGVSVSLKKALSEAR